MSLDALPIWILFTGTVPIVIVSIEAGYRLGKMAHRRSEEEKESPVSGVAGAVLALVAFMLAIAFGIAANHYDARKGLVREEANSIRTAYRRTDFLPEPDRAEAKRLLREYLDARVAFAQAFYPGQGSVNEFLSGGRIGSKAACGTWRSSMPERT